MSIFAPSAMAARIPPQIVEQFQAARNRARLWRVVLWSPVIIGAAALACGGLLLWRGHALIHLLVESRIRIPLVADDAVGVFWTVALAVLGGVLAYGVLLWVTLKGDKLGTMPYCLNCKRVDETLRGVCDQCGESLAERCHVVYPDIFDDGNVLRAYGVKK
ncbi:MAG: hypothetical protein NTV51_29685 [Verrucomicrobia bacterium]|nr:hypothetical protein [Verrucomicrobiota bacterium]